MNFMYAIGSLSQQRDLEISKLREKKRPPSVWMKKSYVFYLSERKEEKNLILTWKKKLASHGWGRKEKGEKKC